MNKHVEAFLKKIKVDPDLIKPLLDLEDGDNLPDSFDMDKVANKHLKNQKEVLESTIKKELENSREEEWAEREKGVYAKITNSIKGQLKKAGDLDLDKNIKDAELDEVVTAFISSMESQAKKGDPELKKALAETREKLTHIMEDNQNLKTKLEDAEKEKETFKSSIEKSLKVDRMIDEILDRVPFAAEGKALAREKQNIKRDIQQFEITPDGKILDKNSNTAVIKPDETGAFKDVEEYINYYVDDYGLRKRSKKPEDLPPPPDDKLYKDFAGDDADKRKVVAGINKEVDELSKELGLSK